MKIRTTQDVISEVESIKSERRDYESAHSDEDELHVAVLKEVAAGNPEAREMAREALKTLDIKFARYCA